MNPAKLAKTPPVATGGSRTDALCAVLRGRRRLLVLTHNNPDPDSLGGALGLMELARLAAGVESRFAITGKILRAENQAMVRELGIQLERLEAIQTADFDCVALVDTQPGLWHTIVPAGTTVDIVLDHHQSTEAELSSGNNATFVDVRPEIGSTSSIVAGHLIEAGVKPSREAATALFYG